MSKNSIILGCVAVIIIGGLLFFGANTRAKLLDARSELAASKVLYSLVEQEKIRLDSMIAVYDYSIALRDEVIAINEAKIAKQQDSIKRLKKGLHEALDNTAKVNADSSYKYINSRIKPVSELKYPFDSIQVKNIHYTFIERDWLSTLNTSLDTLNNSLLKDVYLKNGQILDLHSLVNTYKSKEDIWKKENEAYVVEIDGLDKQVKKQKNMKNIAVGATAGAIVFILINAIN